MTTYAVQDRLTGDVVHAYGADVPDHTGTYPFDQFNHIPQPEAVPAPADRTLSKLEYLRRFTTAERVTIRHAAKSEPVLEDYLAMLELAQDINLDDPDTVAAVGMLEQVGLIAQGRAAEVLA